MAPSLGRQAVSSTLWSAADVVLRQGLQLGITIALARLLGPEEFGLVAIIHLFTGIATVFVNSGLSMALVQRETIDRTDESTVFWFNLTMGASMTGLLWFASPVIAEFFSQPILAPLTALMAVNVMLGALSTIHTTLLTRHLDFRTQTGIGAFSTVVSGAIAIGMAWRGHGVWALAAQTLAASAVSGALLWTLHAWRPAFTFSFDSARKLLGVGGYLFASGLLDNAYNRLYTVLIGRLHSISDLGFYHRAESTKQLPAGMLAGVLSRVSLAVFSRAAGDQEKLLRGVRLALRGFMLLNIPMMLGMAVLADPLLEALFGARWRPAAPLLQILCLGGIFWPMNVVNLTALTAQGHARLYFRLELVKKLLGVTLIVAASLHGIMAVAWSQAVFGLTATLINAHYTRKHLGYGALRQARDILPMLVASLPMVMLVGWMDSALAWPPGLRLPVEIGAGAILYVAWIFAFRLTAARELAGLLRSARGGRK